MENKFASRLKELLESNRISKAQFTRDTGVSTPTLDKWLDGTLPNLSNALLIAEKYNVSLDWLCGTDIKKEVQNTSSFTEFNAQQYLVSLVVFLSEISFNVRKEKEGDGFCALDKIVIETDNQDLVHIISQTHSLLDTYRNGTLPKEMFIACINMLLQKYSDYVFEFGNFSEKKYVLFAIESLNEYYQENDIVSNADKIGVHNIMLCYENHSRDWTAFVSNEDINKLFTEDK